MSWLRNLQHQPKSVRDQVAFWMAGGLTGLIALVWVVSLPSRFAEKEVVVEQKPAAEDAADTDAKTELTNILKDAGGQLSNLYQAVAGPATTTTASSSDNGAVQATAEASSTTVVATATSSTSTQEAVMPPREPSVILLGTSSVSTTTTN